MKDTITTKIIPKTHKSVLLFLLFTFFLGFFIFIALLEGFRIDRLTYGGIKVEKLYLKWDKALHIKAEKLDLTHLISEDTPLTLKPLSKLPKTISFIESWVNSIHIDVVQYKKFKASIDYQKGSTGKVTILENTKRYGGTFDLNSSEFRFTLPYYAHHDANISTNLSIDLSHQNLHSIISLKLPQTPLITFAFIGNQDTLYFKGKVHDSLTTVKPLVDFFDLDPDVKPWVVAYAKATSIDVNHISGTFHYDKPEKLVKNLRVYATVMGGEYTFAKGFDPIRTSKIDLSFMDGKLHILPKNGTFYTLPTEQSYLIIDFTTPNIMLDAYIKTQHGKLNDPITSLLAFYDIHLPIKQISGECAVDLHLAINLHSFDTTAKGVFSPTPSEILLDKILLKTEGGIVNVDGNHVTFENFTAHYGNNIADAKVAGEYDTSTERGIVTINAYAISLIKNLTLFNPLEPLRVTYIIAPDGDSLQVQKSHWNLFGEKLIINPFIAPFDYHRAYCSLPSVPFKLSNRVKGSINTIFDGTKKQSHAKVRLHEFKLGEVELHNAPFDIDVQYMNETATFKVTNISAWSIHKLPLLISPFTTTLTDDLITFEQIETVLGDLLKGSFSGSYRIENNQGTVRLSNMVPLSPKVVPIIDKKESLELFLNAKNDDIQIDAPALNAHFSTISKGWKIRLDDISLLSKKSPILRHYHINNGYLNLYYTGEASRYQFNGEIDYLYPLMLINDNPISHYRFSGSHQNNLTTIRVNDRLTINHTPENIYIRAKNTGLNIPILFKFLSAHKEENPHLEKTEPSPPITIHATNSYLHLMKGRKIITDTLDATLVDDNFDASLHHMNGSANLKIRHDLFSIDGKGFNDKFMEHLFALSDFNGGTFSFQAKGQSDSFDGLMRVENTLLKDYKVLNNVLAFINTVPSLATFSLPNYNSKGLPLEEGYAHFVFKKGVVSVDNFTLNSPEMKIMGSGHADLNTQKIEGSLTLKTDLGSSLGKIPMVGYILLGDDGSLSTTLTLSGKLDNPKVDTSIAKEIVTAPFNILKRTLVYPFLWMMDDKKKK
jgi:hypothetical protein